MTKQDVLAALAAPLPADENQRLAALRACYILDTPREPFFDRLTALAASIFDVEIALISLVDRDRQWFKSAVGLSASETSRQVSFCAHAILDDKVMVVPDARKDRRFAGNALVTDAPFIRFYAGAPLRTFDGYRLGTLCIIESHPRPGGLSDKETDMLRHLAALAIHQIEKGW